MLSSASCQQISQDWMMPDAQDLLVLSLESPCSSQHPSAIRGRLSATEEKGSGSQGTDSSWEEHGGRVGWLQDEETQTWQINELPGEGSPERPGDKEQQHIHPGWGTAKSEWKTVPAAERSAEPLGPVQPGLIPAQGSLLIKCPFNPWIFCLGME